MKHEFDDDFFTEDEGTIDGDTATADELLEAELSQLDDLFENSETPDLDEIEGSFRAVWLAGALSQYLPDFVKKLRPAVAASELFPWKGMTIEKSFSDESVEGTNLLFDMDDGRRMFDFEGRAETSVYDDMECLALDYNVETNIPVFRNLRDEIRMVNASLLLGRGNLMIGGEPYFIGYFCLEKQ